MLKTMFDAAAKLQPQVHYPRFVHVPGIFNPHVHPRDPQSNGDGRAEMLVPLFAGGYEEVIGIGNTKKPLTTTALAAVMGRTWRSFVPQGKSLRIHVAGLMTESTRPQDVVMGYDKPEGQQVWLAMKMFLRSVSNAHGADVDNVDRMIPVLKAMTHTRFKHRKEPMRLMIHAERKFDRLGQRINIFGREKAAIERDIPYLLEHVPKAKLIICHVSDATTVQVIRHLRSQGYDIRGEICPQYTRYTCDDLYEGPDGGTAQNSHLFCLPIFKTEADRLAVMEAMLSGETFWHYATDEACHWDDPTQSGGVKTNSAGYTLGGQTQIPEAVLSYVVEKFVEAGKTELLANFLSNNGRDAYGLPRSTLNVRFERLERDWTVPMTVGNGKGKTARVAMGGEKRKYLLAA